MTAPLEPPAQATVDVVDRWHRYMRGELPGGLEQARIVEFRVMVRPLQALNTVHELMGAALQAFSEPGTTTATSAIATGR